MNYPYIPHQLHQPQKPDFLSWLIILATILILIGIARVVWAQEYTNDEIANAIYKAENSVKYPYGIKSIPTYGNKDYARKICLNTIRNHRKRHAKHNCGKDFLTCLWHRYCPPTAHRLNKSWLKNVKYYLAKQ